MKNLFIAALTACVLVGCTQEQSWLNLNAIPGEGTIKGKVLYEVGYVSEGNVYLNAPLPAANIEVVAEVEYQEYDNGSTGSKKYVVTTNNNGEYEVKIPVGNEDVSVKIYPRSFETNYNGTLDTNGNIITNTAYYSSNGTTVTTSCGENKIVDDIIMRADANEINSRNIKVSLVGQILGDIEAKEKDAWEKYDGDKYVKDKKGIKCNFTITLMNGSKKIIYNNLATNSTGDYSVSVNLFDTWKLSETTVNIETDAFLTNNFEHYYFVKDVQSWRTQSLQGIYGSSSKTFTLSNDALLINEKVSDINISFRPTEPSQIKGIGNPLIDKDEDGISKYIVSNPFNWSYE